MSRLSDLLRQLAESNPSLAEDLRREAAVLSQRRPFGLNFERHVPETFALPGRQIRRGDKVVFRHPQNGTSPPNDSRTWVVTGFVGKGEKRTAKLGLVADNSNEPESAEGRVNDLVVVAEFRDPIYPGLRSTGRVERESEKPFHLVINGENYHVLEALTFAYTGTIDCIYTDPPYNTRDKDWKYNNDYVDAEDAYRHSKWLAMMERRLRLARALLNPASAVLIVTIDENEYLHLGLLLDQIFPDSKIQMISSVIKPGGTSRTKEFSRVEEYLYFVFIGAAEVARSGDNMLVDTTAGKRAGPLAESDFWEGMIRRGIGVVRSQRPKQFYPIYIDAEDRRIVDVGDVLPPEADRHQVSDRDGLDTVWPIKDDLTEGFWQLSPSGLAKAMGRGTVRVGNFNEKTGQWRIQYMKAGKAKAVENGAVKVKGKDANGVVLLDLASGFSTDATPRTVWNRASHDASVGGAGLLNKLIPGRKFPYPKSLYAVEDALRFAVGNQPDARILDFFAGSGTTAHAVARLNRQDGGRRQSIMVTDNEVSPDEAKALRAQGVSPGDLAWEALGICKHVTEPRVNAAFTGKTPDGDEISGSYGFRDEFPMSDGLEENAEFFDLSYEDPERVRHGLGFEEISPLLWMRAGSRGPRITNASSAFAIVDTYAVLFEMDASSDFVAAVRGAKDLRIAYVVTDDETQFQIVAAQLPRGIETVRLYSAYLDNFKIAPRE